MYNHRNFLLLAFAALFICISFNGCFLDRSVENLPEEPPTHPRPATPVGQSGASSTWSADAFPGFACPADNISLTWDVGDPMCATGTGPSCQTLSVFDNVLLLVPPYNSRELNGTHLVGNVSSLSSWSGRNPVFTLNVTHDDPSDPGWVVRESEVIIVQNPPVEPVLQNFQLTALCDPVSGRWRLDDYRLDMSNQSFIDATKGLGHCVRITEICYNRSAGGSSEAPNPIVLSLVGAPSMPSVTLESGGPCARGFNLKPDLAYRVQPASPLLYPTTGRCIPGTTSDPLTSPPYVYLTFSLNCDTETDECGN